MALDQMAIQKATEDYYGNLPHPEANDVPVNQYSLYQNVAARLNSSQTPTGDQTNQAYLLLQNLQMTPAEFERVWDISKPMTNRLLSRDPTVHELVDLAHQPPNAIHDYYMNHPDPIYPEVKAGDMAKYSHTAEPIARAYAGRSPNQVELARFAIGNYSAEDMAAHYQDNWQ
jgi:hypothetical protein